MARALVQHGEACCVAHFRTRHYLVLWLAVSLDPGSMARYPSATADHSAPAGDAQPPTSRTTDTAPYRIRPGECRLTWRHTQWRTYLSAPMLSLPWTSGQGGQQ